MITTRGSLCKPARFMGVRLTTTAVTGSVPSDRTTQSSFKDYWKLSKGHLSVWVALSALPGYLVCAPFSLPAASAVFAGTALASASSQALNQIRESERDAKMSRTRNRPIPCGRISVDSARRFAALTGTAGCGLLTAGAAGSLAPAAIALSTIGLYVNVYTPMKTRSEYNTHVGAVAGSLPVLIGFACAGGFPIFLTPEPWVLLTLQTIWQFPHFYPLAWLYREDYTAGGYRMFPLNDATGKETASMCMPYMGVLWALPYASCAIGATSWMFAVSGSVANALWSKQWLNFYTRPSKASAKTFFLGSLWYLMLIMGLYVVHLNEQEDSELHHWRKRLKAKMGGLCMHEREAGDPMVPASLCPALPNVSETPSSSDPV